jgi:hypothetical protein
MNESQSTDYSESNLWNLWMGFLWSHSLKTFVTGLEA